MNEFWEDNKKKIITAGIIVAITIVIGIVNIFMNGASNKQSSKKALEELGKAYYEEIYYPALKKQYADDYKTILNNYSKDGMKVTLRELVRSIENSDTTFFYTKGNYCNFVATYITIYPNGNYEKEDYNLTTRLSCVKNIEADEVE